MKDYSEQWDEICFLLSDNIHADLPERDFENQVVRAIEVLGWREFRKEIDRQRTLQLGRNGILRPDLIVYGNNRKALIVIEVKRPGPEMTRDKGIGQLRSYMRQMKCDLGLLIGSDLKVFYDGSLNPQSDPILLERIDFEKQSEKGTIFVEVFNKSSLAENRHHEYLENKLQQFNRERQVSSLVQQLISLETKRKVEGYLRNEFSETDDKIFSDALQQVRIDISRKEEMKHEIVKTAKQERPSKGKLTRDQTQRRNHQSFEGASPGVEIASIPFEHRSGAKLRQIYGVLHFMKEGLDFPGATKATLRLFAEVQDYQTISDKCARGFAGDVDTFVSWFNSGQILHKLTEQFSLRDHDQGIFRELLEP